MEDMGGVLLLDTEGHEIFLKKFKYFVTIIFLNFQDKSSQTLISHHKNLLLFPLKIPQDNKVEKKNSLFTQKNFSSFIHGS